MRRTPRSLTVSRVGEVVGKRTAQFARIWVRAKWDIACEGCEDNFAEVMVNE